MEKKQVIKIREKKKSVTDNIVNYLFEDVRLMSGLTSIVGVIVIIIFFKLFLIGVQQNLIKGYFEIMVLSVLMLILMFVVPFEVKGWVGIVNMILMFGGVIYWINDSLILYRMGLYLIGYFMGLQIIYNMAWYIAKKKERL